MNPILANDLAWYPQLGLGYYEVKDDVAPYDAEYFARYERQANTDMGRALTQARIDMVNRHLPLGAPLCDVGIGCGQFIQMRDASAKGCHTCGNDVNPFARRWLQARGKLMDLTSYGTENVSMWDVFEHIRDPRPLLEGVRGCVFMSLPIFSGPEHVLRSKHFRKDEHYWYFTADGLRGMMARNGFHCTECNAVETVLGREDILSFAFKRGQ